MVQLVAPGRLDLTPGTPAADPRPARRLAPVESVVGHADGWGHCLAVGGTLAGGTPVTTSFDDVSDGPFAGHRRAMPGVQAA